MFGIGAGWVPAETAHHGVAFERAVRRDARARLAMRAALTGHEVSYQGEFVRFDGVRSLETVQQPAPSILIGGAGARARAAVAEYGDGWMPIHPFEPTADVPSQDTTVCFFAGTDDDDAVARYAAVGVQRCVIACDPNDLGCSPQRLAARRDGTPEDLAYPARTFRGRRAGYPFRACDSQGESHGRSETDSRGCLRHSASRARRHCGSGDDR